MKMIKTEKTPYTDVVDMEAIRDNSSKNKTSVSSSSSEDFMNTEKYTLAVRNLDVFFDKNQVLFDVNMAIPRNKVVAVIGPSGCGKSTFIRCLNRMHELVPRAHHSGEIFLDGIDIYSNKIDPAMIRRKIGMVFQKPNAFPTMSIYDNVASGIKLVNLRKPKNLDQIVETSLRKAGLWNEVKDKLQDKGTFLSGGQQQRLCIARALAIQPAVLLMDEPTSALDPMSTAHIEDLILELKEDYTVVIITHNIQQAARISDYTAFFYLGKLIEYDNTDKIFENPSNELTEKYITGKFG